MSITCKKEFNTSDSLGFLNLTESEHKGARFFKIIFVPEVQSLNETHKTKTGKATTKKINFMLNLFANLFVSLSLSLVLVCSPFLP